MRDEHERTTGDPEQLRRFDLSAGRVLRGYVVVIRKVADVLHSRHVDAVVAERRLGARQGFVQVGGRVEDLPGRVATEGLHLPVLLREVPLPVRATEAVLNVFGQLEVAPAAVEGAGALDAAVRLARELDLV